MPGQSYKTFCTSNLRVSRPAAVVQWQSTWLLIVRQRVWIQPAAPRYFQKLVSYLFCHCSSLTFAMRAGALHWNVLHSHGKVERTTLLQREVNYNRAKFYNGCHCVEFIKSAPSSLWKWPKKARFEKVRSIELLVKKTLPYSMVITQRPVLTKSKFFYQFVATMINIHFLSEWPNMLSMIGQMLTRVGILQTTFEQLPS